MPLIFLLSLVLSAVILAALWVAQVSASRARSRASQLASAGSSVLTIFRARKPFSIIRVADAFEPETSILWETQMPALELISSGGWRGLPRETLRSLYVRSVALYPELYEGTEFEGWLQFLEDAKLIVCNKDMVAITPAGAEFLRCRVAANAVV